MAAARPVRFAAFALLRVAVASGCSSGTSEPATVDEGNKPNGESSPARDQGAPTASTPPAAAQPQVAGCHEKPGAGAVVPPPLPKYAGTCPSMAPAPAPGVLTFTDGSSAGRQFLVVRPKDQREGEVLPVIFVWHWL